MDSNLGSTEMLQEKWAPVLNHTDMAPITDPYKKSVTAVILENQEKALREERGMLNETPANAAGGGLGLAAGNSNANMQGFDPILISLVRRALPNLMAYDVCGVQPMTGPTGLIFAMRAKYSSQSGTEALFNEAQNFAGAGASGAHTKIGQVVKGTVADGALIEQGILGGATQDPLAGFAGFTRTAAEALTNTGENTFPEMAFSIERTAVEAKTRALKAEYTTELAQDLKAVHGLDAESELANILSSEILAEINREVMRTIYRNAKLGAQQLDLFGRQAGTSTAGITSGVCGAPSPITTGATIGVGGIYDIARDADGRWSAERFRGLMFQIERECNKIAKDTRRGKGNFIICSSDVASALAMGGFLNISPAINQSLNVDDTGNTFAGTLNGKIKVYIDPYAGPGTAHTAATDAGRDFVCVGYKGTSAYDAGLFYCPYVPLQMVRAVGENTFQPKIGFKTRYGLVNNPFVSVNTGSSDPNGGINLRRNQYYRIFRVDNLHGIGQTSNGSVVV